MTRPIHGSFVKEDGSSISDHLRNHVHLTNCIHLKNHMHRHSPILAERSLMRDLLVLQRSRSLRDPSTSPPSWQTPSIVDAFARKHNHHGMPLGGRRSVGSDHRQRESFSPWLPSVSNAKVSSIDIGTDKAARKEGEFSRKGGKSNVSVGGQKSQTSLVSDNRGQYSGHNGFPLKTLSEQLEHPIATDNELAKHPRNFHHNRIARQQLVIPEAPPGNRDQPFHSNIVKRRKFKGARRAAQGPSYSRDTELHNDSSFAPNSLSQGSMRQSYRVREEDAEMKHVCGIPWNWSRLHHRGKTFLDKAGRSLSCGLSDPTMRKGELHIPHNQRDNSDAPTTAADHSYSSRNSDSDVLPLLNDDACESQQSPENPYLAPDYSGELGIFASRNEQDSDISSDIRSGNRRTSERHSGRHQTLSQKYMPKTFKDLVGQNLVVQALSNAVMRKRVGLVYVFYGPQGTGKSSCARVFARALNCQSHEHMKPCGVCASCISHNLGKSRNTLEVSNVANFDFERIADVFENTIFSSSSQFRVFIIDDCDALPADSWTTISNVIDRAPRHVVFVLVVSTGLDHLPHIITSRCQKFFFPKLKDTDIVHALQRIASSERLEVDMDALKLIASRSDGSLRDAEMSLDQLSLLGQTISLHLVQEFVGLVSNEKLVDLLDLALSADTVNTVKCLREITEAGVEPLALMSQLATIITDILAGSYVFTREKRRKFFRRPTLSKDEMENLRQALKTLSESEKQLRMSNDKITWLTAALLQLAPDQQYMMPNSSLDTSFTHSPMPVNYATERVTASNGSKHKQESIPNNGRPFAKDSKNSLHESNKTKSGTSIQAHRSNSRKDYIDSEKIWQAVIEQIQINALKHFMHQEGKLVSVSFGAAPTVQLIFSSRTSKSKAEKFREHILQAFESVLCTGVTLEMRCGSWKDSSSEAKSQHEMTTTETVKEVGSSEIVEMEASPQQKGSDMPLGENQEDVSCSHNESTLASKSQRRDNGQQSKNQSLVRGKVSLAHVIQQAEGCSQRSGWSKQKAISIAEKLEQENLRLEPRSRNLLYWKASRYTRRKLLHLRMRTKRSNCLLKLMACGRCQCTKTPR